MSNFLAGILAFQSGHVRSYRVRYPTATVDWQDKYISSLKQIITSNESEIARLEKAKDETIAKMEEANTFLQYELMRSRAETRAVECSRILVETASLKVSALTPYAQKAGATVATLAARVMVGDTLRLCQASKDRLTTLVGSVIESDRIGSNRERCLQRARMRRLRIVLSGSPLPPRSDLGLLHW